MLPASASTQPSPLSAAAPVVGVPSFHDTTASAGDRRLPGIGAAIAARLVATGHDLVIAALAPDIHRVAAGWPTSAQR